MENLQITGTVRQVMRHSGAAVLTVTLPRVVGDTPAASHAREMLLALSEFAAARLLPDATAALVSAAREGRLLSFTPHTLTVSLTSEARRGGIRLVLVAVLLREGAEKKITKTTYWQGERFRRRWLPPAKKQAKARKKR